MNKKTDLEKLKEEEQYFSALLKSLEQQSNDLENQPDKKSEKDGVDAEIATTKASLDEVNNAISVLEGAEKDELLPKGLNEKGEFIEEVGGKILSIQEALERKTQTEIGTAEKIDDFVTMHADPTAVVAMAAVVAGAYVVNKLSEQKDVVKEWDKDIREKETTLKESHDTQLQSLEQNHAMLESQLKDTKKEGFEEKLVQLEKEVNKEKLDINNKFEKEMGKIKDEKEAFIDAKESTKGMQVEERNQEIKRQREEFERQQKLERQKEAERNR